MNSLSHIIHNKIVVIVRGLQPNDVLPVAYALYEGGIRTLEITLNSPNALSVIETLALELGENMLIGAGTVLDSAAAVNAITAGAKFIISPIVDSDTIQTTKAKGAVSIPGAYTPTEIFQAYQSGADIVKVFPASIGPKYIKDIRGPLPHIPLMPTGGVDLKNIQAFLNAGAVALGIGSALIEASQKMNANYIEELVEKARQFVHAAHKIEVV